MNDVIKIKKPNQVSNVKVSHEASSFYADLSKQWATKLDKAIENGEYSSKYYAKISEQNANSAKESVNKTEVVASNVEKLVNNTLIFPELKIGNKDVILDKLKYQKHTTFDKSKFTIIGSPTIANDGIASGFSNKNYLLCSKVLSTTEKHDVIFKTQYTHLKDDYSISGYIFNILTTASNYNGVLIRTTKKIALVLNGKVTPTQITPEIGKCYNIEFKTDFQSYANLYVDNNLVATSIDTATTSLPTNGNVLVGLAVNGEMPLTTGSISLPQFSISVDGKEVFSGNKTGVDTIIIGNKEVEIPYTQSKTGAKIVNSNYRDRVQNLYEQVGYTHYYTLGKKDYTLATCKSSDIVAAGEVNGIVYTRTADLTLTQRGSCTNGTAVKLLPYKDKDSYQISTPYSEKTRNSFTPSATGDFIAIGKTVIE